MRLSCNFVNVYTIVYHVQYTRVHARIPNGHPREEKPDKSRRTSRRAERASRGRPRAPNTPTSTRSEVGEEVRVGVGVGPVEFKL